ncbi:BREX-1 system adenine-specific DNA-methyltransferase PglX [bacterium]|nr:BREX-1 system adenine-specific DNA-methyltransferase PglX [bacterium]
METSQLKNYGPRARQDFIESVKNRAAVYGLLPTQILPMKEEGDVVIIGDRPFPRSVAKQRKRLEERIRREGFDQFIEAVAYTWFNRFVAIRFMELHGYLDHSYRVLSHPEGESTPEILENAERVELPGLDKEKVVELKLDGTKDEELYRLLLLAQCNALHQAMPFLFEKIGDETELLLPANLLHTDSLIRQLVEQVDEALWQEIEIIGWLYQFYISEKKDEVIGKVVKSEDIPAATQLFTPNWIVKYMVQNSLGAQWLATYPQSPLKGQMEYYIEPAEQTDEVNAQLAAITPSQLNPEELTLIDPASGSGHILVEAYDLFKAIYLERGYRQRDIPQMILTQNLFGLDIDERAAQLTGFALMMKGRADDRRLFEREVKLNVLALVDSEDLDANDLYAALMAVQKQEQSFAHEPPAPSDQLFETEDNLFTRSANTEHRPPPAFSLADVEELIKLFEHATTFGSLIQVPEELAEKLPAMKQLSLATSPDLFVAEALKRLGPLVRQAELLAVQYDAVVANPPYMGGKYQSPRLKKFAKDEYPQAKGDLFSCFIERGYTLSTSDGYNSMVTMQSWMFLGTFRKMRSRMLQEKTIRAMVHMSNGVMGIAFGTAATVLRNNRIPTYIGSYSHTSLKDLSPDRSPIEFPVRNKRLREVASEEFQKIPGSPVAYWVDHSVRRAFIENVPLSEHFAVKKGMDTGSNDLFLKRWAEVAFTSSAAWSEADSRIAPSAATWFPYNKGGSFRKWYGNQEYFLNWKDDGRQVRAFEGSTLRNEQYHFCPSVSWSDINASSFAVRQYPAGFIHDNAGPSVFGDSGALPLLLAFMSTPLVPYFLSVLNPTVHYQIGNVSELPWRKPNETQIAGRCLEFGTHDWNAYERSWDFQSLPLLTASSEPIPTLESSYTAWITQNKGTIAEMKRLEEENNRLFIDAYGLADELTPEVPIEQITLTVNPAYRYGGKLTEEEQWSRFRQDTLEELVSYAIGCMMGRYSLDAPGLIYAHSGNEGFDPSQYTTFPADDDGIVPLTDTEWFDDDACNRVIEFIDVAWKGAGDESHLEDNLTFLADNLSPKKNESSRETLRRYLCDKFFKDHLQTYKKRPIYWLFSSGKQKAFQCLVYLHRYNEGTLARMRTKYVVQLQGKLNARIEQLENDVPAASSTSHRKTLERERDKLIKQREELQTFDEKLRHYADQRIKLDLDDGVKVNYGKFGDLLAEVKAVHGKKPQMEGIA